MTATSTPRAVGRSRGAFVSLLLGTRHERSTARDGLMVCSGRMTATSTPRAVGRSRGAFVSLLLGTRHERSTAREMVRRCSEADVSAQTISRAVDRSWRVPSRRLAKAPRERPTARGVHASMIRPLHTKRPSRAVDRSCRVPSRRLTKAPRERPTARGVLVAVIQPLQTKRSRCVLGFYRLAATATSLTIHTLKQSSCSQRALTPKVVTHAST